MPVDATSHAADVLCASSHEGSFHTTRWSQVTAAGGTTSPRAAAALEQLCRDYWYPLYAYVRRQGHSVEDAQDLTQQFFARLLERKHLRLADRERGRFRTFLLTSLKHFLINEWNKAQAGKRGGGRRLLSLDAEATETRFVAEPADGASPDKEFDRRWAMVLLERVLEELARDFGGDERAHVFEVLKPCLAGEELQDSYAEIGLRLGMSESNVKVTVHRLRRRYVELLRAEIGRTLGEQTAIDHEIQELFAALNN
jgi:RNA polymerase sigma-70 factor (ECF subfamily)